MKQQKSKMQFESFDKWSIANTAMAPGSWACHTLIIYLALSLKWFLAQQQKQHRYLTKQNSSDSYPTIIFKVRWNCQSVDIFYICNRAIALLQMASRIKCAESNAPTSAGSLAHNHWLSSPGNGRNTWNGDKDGPVNRNMELALTILLYPSQVNYVATSAIEWMPFISLFWKLANTLTIHPLSNLLKRDVSTNLCGKWFTNQNTNIIFISIIVK